MQPIQYLTIHTGICTLLPSDERLIKVTCFPGLIASQNINKIYVCNYISSFANQSVDLLLYYCRMFVEVGMGLLNISHCYSCKNLKVLTNECQIDKNNSGAIF
jgi:hypothetical protein